LKEGQVEYPHNDNTKMEQAGSRWRRLGPTLLAATALTLPVAVWSAVDPQAHDALAAVSVVGAESRVVGGGEDSYAPVVEAVAPAVVTIRAEQRVTRAVQQRLPFADDPLFREFFGDRIPMPNDEGPGLRQGLGSGVIVGTDGHILTNHHVIDGADRIRVELTDGRSFDATVVGSDAPSDLAVLKVNATALPAVPLGDSDAVRVGDVVLAVGNPMGVGQTVTMGIVSAKGRATGLGDGSFEDFLQTDAPINRGNSGGALVSTRGELIGINSQILSPSGGNIGIGFAIPANMARHVMDSLIDDGTVHRGMLGVTIQAITPDLARSLGLATTRGALVSSVSNGGAAEKAGIRRGDVILAINGDEVSSSNDLRNRVASTRPGTGVTLTVLRDGEEQTLSATLGELPSDSRASAGAPATEGEAGALGLRLQPVPADRARALNLQTGEGLMVASVAPGSPAGDAGLRSGDVIEEVNGRRVRSADDLRSAVNASKDRPALVLVRRGEGSLYLTLAPRR
jgi:Do/DeqQ family serine protease